MSLACMVLEESLTKTEDHVYDKAEECSQKMERLQVLLRKTIKNIKYCRQECRSASTMLGAINDATKDRE
jgi:hypothetical protein